MPSVATRCSHVAATEIGIGDVMNWFDSGAGQSFAAQRAAPSCSAETTSQAISRDGEGVRACRAHRSMPLDLNLGASRME